MRVDNKLTGDGKLNVELNFKSIDDFDPDQIAQQVGPLRDLLKMRKELTLLMSKMEGNDKLEQLLSDVLSNTDTARAMARELGVAGGDAAPESASEEAPNTEAE
jgi:type VI secretion system protein ImpB